MKEKLPGGGPDLDLTDDPSKHVLLSAFKELRAPCLETERSVAK